MTSLQNKITLVTGSAKGVGRSIALALGRVGARVVVVDVNPAGVQETTAAITQAGGTAMPQVVDVSHKMAVQTMLYDVLDQWERIDVVVNAAYIAPGNNALKMDEWEWNRTLDVNLKGAFLVSQTAARAMQETGGGLIVNVLRPVGDTPHAGVRAARAGLVGLTEACAAEWGVFGVRVEAVDGEAVMKSLGIGD